RIQVQFHDMSEEELEFIPDSLLQPSSDKMAFIDRLANSITKRKRSTPQKFHIHLHLADAPYELSAGLGKDGEMPAGELDTPHFTGLGGEYAGVAGNGGGGVSDTMRPLHLPTTRPSSLSELRPIHNSIHMSTALDLPASQSHAPSPSNSCLDSTDTESMPDEPCNSTALTLTLRNRHNPSHAKDMEVKREDGGHSALRPPAASFTSRESFRVVDGEGRAVRSFRCEHCRVLFLDHVMYTIHMGCHGFRQPFECNICGHRSQDRYEFSSHIVRGEHILD
uniref:IKAROS family zinc finger 4 n=1 Tax=Cyclopterus lumpus TaxID=8103 RepID=A0A8C2XS40_CYCLU